ncbi:MAG TPA: phasin family protein [Methylocystis sp.]|nr:phasin family protein [Methylocystis sp.]
MLFDFSEIKAFGANPFEAFVKANPSTESLQAIAAETAEYSKTSFEKGRAFYEKLLTVKQVDEALALQSDFAKSSYEDFVSQATKISELYATLVQSAFKPFTNARQG